MKTQSLIDCIEMTDSYKRYGKVKRVIGLMIESKGPARLNWRRVPDLCKRTIWESH